MVLKTLMRFFIVLMEIQKAQVEPAEWRDKAAKPVEPVPHIFWMTKLLFS